MRDSRQIQQRGDTTECEVETEVTPVVVRMNTNLFVPLSFVPVSAFKVSPIILFLTIGYKIHCIQIVTCMLQYKILYFYSVARLCSSTKTS